MTEVDLDQVAKLEREIFPDPWPRTYFSRDVYRPHSLALVAVTRDEGAGGKTERVVGYAVAWVQGELHLANIAVAPAERRKGIGTALLAKVEEFGRELGASSVYLEVRESNVGAQAFYRRQGFVQTYVRPGYYANRDNAVIMEKDLLPPSA